MPALANARHEKFALEIVKGSAKGKAYQLAGFAVKSEAGGSASATRLLNNANIAARIEELKNGAAELSVVTRAGLLDELAKIAFAPLGHKFVKVSDKRAAAVDYLKAEGWDQSALPESPLDRLARDELRDLVDRIRAERARRLGAGSADAPTSRPH